MGIYTIFKFELSGWARVVNMLSYEYIQLSTKKGFIEVMQGTKEQCEEEVRRINSRMKPKTITSELLKSY
jgi:hypothetical protein